MQARSMPRMAWGRVLPRVICAMLAALALSRLAPAGAEIVTEDFQAYPIQSDTTGFIDPDPDEGPITTFRITTTGNTGPSDPIVATVSEVLAASAGIETEGANRFWTLGSSAGPTGTISGEAGHVMIGDIGRLAPDIIIPTGGPLATFFSTPRNLTGGEISARVRETTAAASTQFRFLLKNAADREIWTAAFPLTTAFQTFTVPVTAFTIPVDPSEGEGPFDFRRVELVGFEIFTTPGIAPALSFNVDDVRIDAPAPRSMAMPWLLLLRD